MISTDENTPITNEEIRALAHRLMGELDMLAESPHLAFHLHQRSRLLVACLEYLNPPPR